MKINGLTGPAKVLTAYKKAKAEGRALLFLTYNEIESVSIFQDLSSFEDVVRFPPAGTQILETTVSNTNQGRVDAMIGALNGKSVVASIDALLPYVAPADCFKNLSVTLDLKTEIEISDLAKKLVNMGFERVDMVDGFGQFAVRGDIVDIGYTENYRIEFFDVQIFAIRELDINTQRSGNDATSIQIYPVTTTPVTDYSKLFEGLEKELKSIGASIEVADTKMKARLERYMNAARQGVPFADLESLACLLYDQPDNIISYLDNPIVVVDEPEKVAERIETYYNSFLQKFTMHYEKGQALSFQQEMYDINLLEKLPEDKLELYEFYSRKEENIIPTKRIYEKPTISEEFFNFIASGTDYKTYVFCGNEKRAKRFIEMLAEQEIGANYLPEFDDIEIGKVVCLPEPLSASVEYIDEKVRLISDREHGKEKKKSKKRQMDIFIDLEPGDFIVHEAHGIGKYLGLKTITSMEKSRDYLLIEYDKGDKLYLPTDQMDRIQKYVGAGDGIPKLSKLGGKDWEKVKNRVKASVQDMAEDLIRLYADRNSRKGYAFSQDTPWQNQFEDSFEFEDTDDQASSISEIKADMENGTIMDRLLCGDVGYGKTEVALRAMFKCVMDSKQTALLVPTTVLASQHYHTIVDRMEGFPVKIACLSRINTPKEQKEILASLEKGEIDIVVGTHKLLNEKIKYKDLGLLVIDEEQRFGVAHKEKIKALKTSVDVLTLSATPIPRTLYMSLIGIRDMSVINTPPQRRQTIATYVMEYSPDLAMDAVMDEISRGGQVYFVYNNVRGMNSFALELQKLIPHARIGIGHGQMPQKELEKVMLDFYAGNIDVLLSSTIVESGLDVENANTIIVYDADRFGLSQLYQLRGRVGRSEKQAFAYFTYRNNLSEKAFKRLSAIRDFTELGSGFKIAMRDLEIRGAGNILGAEQYGHLTEVGYDMYSRLVNDAVNKIKGVEEKPEIDTVLKLDMDVFIPKSFIANEAIKMEIYKKIAGVSDEIGKAEIIKEIEDRFGQPPETVLRLLDVAILKSKAQKAGFAVISKEMYGYVFTYSFVAQIDNEKLLSLSQKYPITIGNKEPFSITLKFTSDNDDEVLLHLLTFVDGLLE